MKTKNKIYLMLIFVVFLVLFMLTAVIVHGDSDKVMLASGEWAPYVSENIEYERGVSRIVRDSFALEGVDVEFVYMPWDQAIEDAKNGEWHGTLPWLKNEEREEHFYFSNPIASENVVFFYKKGLDFSWETISESSLFESFFY